MNFTATWTCTRCKTEFREAVDTVKVVGCHTCGAPYEKLTHIPVVVFDSREQRSGVPQECERLGMEIVIVPNLEVGDIIVSDRTAFERKTAPDLLQDWLENRELFSKLHDLKRAYRNPILLYEGYNEELFTLRGIDPAKVQAMLFTIAKMGIPMVETLHVKGSALAIKWFAEKEQSEEKRLIQLHGKRSALNPKQQKEYVISSFPTCDVGTRTAIDLLTHFGSIDNVIRAGTEELMEVKGIWKVTAEKIRSLILEKY
ncbi:MAG: ERCC4 domain-containing protein [Ignavibacteria bacterium]|nr:ERCC4 domain-containing protein [Ignavibacteria bacterium]